MAIKAGRIVTLGNGALIQRLQTAGVSSLNIPTTQIKETGNDLNVSVERDIPDLKFDLESLDMTVGMEALLTGVSSPAPGQIFNFTSALPLDIAQPYKPTSLTDYTAASGAVIPYLVLSQVSYKFAVKQNSSQTASLSGDSIYFNEAIPYVETFTTAGPSFTFSHGVAQPTTEQGDTFHAYSVTLLFTDGSYKRLFHTAGDYTDTSAGFTLSASNAALVSADAGCQVRATYMTQTTESFPQSVHTDASILPAVTKSYGVQVYISNGAATPTWTRWPGLQSITLDWKVSLQADDELGNYHHVDQDYDTPDVSGTAVMRPSDTETMMQWLPMLTGTAAGQSANATGDVAVPMEIHLISKNDGSRLKTLYVPDAKFNLPGAQVKVGSKLDLSMAYTSDTGTVDVYNGVGPSGI